MKKIYFLLLIFSIIFAACKKNRDAELSTFLIQNEKIIPSSASVELSCEVVSSATITELYLQYGTKADFSKCEEVRMTEGKSSYSVKIDNLTANTTYYVRYLAVNSYSSMTSEKSSKFKTLIKSEPNDPDNPDNPFEPEYVDLGLSVKWATCNVGATKPEDYGDYFAWGEVEPKEIYNWSTYKYCNGSSKALTKYCSHSSYGNNGFTDGKTILDSEDDAAIANWGGAWRMPTDAELTELREKCKWTWISQNDVNGYKVVGPNGNSIFLPAAGYKDGESLLITRSFGNYWSNSLHTDYSDLAYSVYFYSDVVDKYGSNRDHGRSVRPVWGEKTDNPTTKNKYTITVSANSSSYGSVSGGGTYEEGTQVTLTATPKAGYKFTEWNDGNTDNPRVITVTQDESYTAVFEKFEPEYVDLGLSVKWATCNLGATIPEGYGDYFAWGETQPKDIYDWSTYKYCNGTETTLITLTTLTKYCNDSSYGNNGFTDNKTILDPSDDAATVNWGGAWRMPTDEEFTELREKCTWTWTTQNGVNGYKVVGPNGNSIFLPAAGSSSLYDVGSDGYYWSGSLYASGPNYAYGVYFHSSYVNRYDYNRYYGLSVRPVFGERNTNKYTISASSNNSSYGSVSGGGFYAEGTEVTLTATANSGYQFKKWTDGNTDNPRVITVTKDESYTAIFEKFEPEYVDLGLPSGLKWATCNVGAERPEDYGDYFAWGETQPKETYNWSTYKYCNGSASKLTKYCNNSSYGNNGFTDNKTILDLSDDAATVNWGGAWRMPTDAEMTELREKCKWTWTTQNGVNGYKVVGPNGNSIFLPAAGYVGGSSLYNVGSYGDYWSSSLYAGYPNYAYDVYFHSSLVYRYYYGGRYYGRSVRPVCQ